MTICYGRIPRIATNIYMGNMATLDALKTKVDLEAARCRKAGISGIVPNPRVTYSAEKGFYFGSGSFEYNIIDILDYVKTMHTDIIVDAIKLSTVENRRTVYYGRDSSAVCVIYHGGSSTTGVV